MKKIPLHNGMTALVDDDTFPLLSSKKWRAWKCPRHSTWYAINQRGKLMHRQIAGAVRGQKVDHRNGIGLDNQRANLRICTLSQNNANQKKRMGTSSKFKGVTWDKQKGKWRVQIQRNDVHFNVGLFEDEEDAAIYYNVAAQILFGDFARLNPI